MIVAFTVPGTPVAKGRARSFVRNGHVAHYTPERTANYENLVKLVAQQAMVGKELFTCPVLMKIDLFVSIPVSWSKKKQKAALSGEVMPDKRPDLSNVLKSIEDALNGIVYQDDKQIVSLTIEKRYAEIPKANVEVRKFELVRFE